MVQRRAILPFGHVPASQGEKQSLRTDARRRSRWRSLTDGSARIPAAAVLPRSCPLVPPWRIWRKPRRGRRSLLRAAARATHSALWHSLPNWPGPVV